MAEPEKKKIESDIENLFPDLNDTSELKDYYLRVKQKCSILTKHMAGEGDDRDKMKDIDEYFYKLTKPKVFWNVDGQLGEEAKYDKGFETSCVIMSQSINRDPKKMTTQEYLQTLEELRKQQKEWEQKRLRHSRN